ncbi:MAG TPA: tyrosine-type recombinase/integrase [Jiangellaceae bacterium]|nr:tyrosine-type recombinase/integrase [Jiangellaceae bacterium]
MTYPSSRRAFGNVRQLGSGKWQARYRRDGVWYTAGAPFQRQQDALDELGIIRRSIELGSWKPPVKAAARALRPATLREYAAVWLAERDLAATTREHNDQLLRDHIYPTLGDLAVAEITPAAVRAWHAGLARKTGPVARSHAYGLLRTILNTAVADELIDANPCRIRGAGRARTAKRMRPATLPELAVIVAATPERYRLMVQLAVWCSLRFGELAELRRSDIDVKNAVVRVRRGVTRTKGGRIVKGPKTDAGVRDVTIPGNVLGDVTAHLLEHTGRAKDALLFPSATDRTKHLAPSSAYRWYYPAREAAGRKDLRFHDLRHTGQTLAATSGANLRELMARAGQSSPAAALRYLHVVDGRQREIADALAGLAAAGNVTPITTANQRGATG